jgi:hypothetical protein
MPIEQTNIFHRDSATDSQIANPTTTSTDGPNQQNTLYADGAGFRASQADRCIFERQAAYAKSCLRDNAHEPTPEWLVILKSKSKDARDNNYPCFEILEAIYSELLSRLCPQVEPSLLPEVYLAHQDVLLEKASFELFIQLYLDHFHTVNPFLDRSLG